MKYAFSLVELSIVLVILGLLTGGILTGQNLIRTAELRSVTAEYSAYQTAVNTFKDKYFAIPGDMANATDFWGAAAAGATCVTTSGTGTQTCNGDGNGDINVAGWITASASNESFRFWQHLANAGLIEGTYSGISAGGNTYTATIGANLPKSKLSNGGWFTWNWAHLNGVGAAGNFMALPSYENSMTLGTAEANNYPQNPILSPEELWNIDNKIDDGKPTGKVTAWPINNCTNAASETDLASDYELSTSAASCMIVFVNAF